MNPTYNAVNMVSNIGLEENINLTEVGLNIYPNPAELLMSIDVELENENYLNVAVINTHGQLVYSDALENTKKINTSNWSSGVYFLLLETLQKS